MAAKKTVPAPAIAGDNLPVVLPPREQAMQSLSFESTRESLKLLSGKFTRIVRIPEGDEAAFEEAKSARLELRSARTNLEKVSKDARDGAVKFQKACIDVERELVAIISPEEQRLASLVDAEQKRRDDAVAAAKAAEAARARAISDAFARVRALPGLAERAVGVGAIDELIAEAESFRDVLPGIPEDLEAAARYEANVALEALRAARAAKVQADADARELAELRAARVAAAAAAPAPVAPAPVAPEGAKAAPAALTASEARVGYSGVDVAPGVANVHRTPVSRPSLLQAARGALKLLKASGLGNRPEALALEDAIEAEVPL
jgi:hypothetical protein